MIATTDKMMTDWVAGVAPDSRFTLDLPAPDAGAVCVHAYLHDISQTLSQRNNAQNLHSLELNYLCFVSAKDTREAHEVFDKLLTAALSNERFRVDLSPLSDEFWQALNVTRQPAFRILTPMTIDLSAAPAPPVMHEADLNVVPAIPLFGRVLGPDEIPLRNVRVTLPSTHQSTLTDDDGKFSFSAIPARPKQQPLILHAKGRTLSVTTPAAISATEPFIVRFNPQES